VTSVPRVHEFSTVFNFRDLGGYPTTDGRSLRWGQVYRADGLWRLSDTDVQRFAGLGVRTVIDLRRPDELSADGRVADSLGLDYHNVNFHAAPWPEHDLGPDDMPRYLADRYADMADGGLTTTNPIGMALRLLARDAAVPLVFHCAAGKDRTGVLAALTLSVLGVDDDVIADDYALSAEAERRFHAWRRDTSLDEAVEDGHAPAWVLNPCPREAMLFFLVELRERHGSLRAYLERAGMTDADLGALRERLLT
jgi:protein tyrosine/serine phosphatase